MLILTFQGWDCYLIGREAYLEEDWEHTKKWMLEALNLFDEAKDQAQLDINLVYDHMGFAEFKVQLVCCIGVVSNYHVPLLPLSMSPSPSSPSPCPSQ